MEKLDHVLRQSGKNLLESLYKKFLAEEGQAYIDEYIKACAGKGVRPSAEAVTLYKQRAFDLWKQKKGHDELFPMTTTGGKAWTQQKESTWVKTLREERAYWIAVRRQNTVDDAANSERHRQHMIKLHQIKSHKKHLRDLEEQNNIRKQKQIQLKNSFFQDEHVEAVQPCPFCEKRAVPKKVELEKYSQYNFSGKVRPRQQGFTLAGKTDLKVVLEDDVVFGSCHLISDGKMMLVTGTNGYKKGSLTPIDQTEEHDVSGFVMLSDVGKISLRLYTKDHYKLESGEFLYLLTKRGDREIEIDFYREEKVEEKVTPAGVFVEDLGPEEWLDNAMPELNISYIDSGPEAMSFKAVGADPNPQREDPMLKEYFDVYKSLLKEIVAHRCGACEGKDYSEERIPICCVKSHIDSKIDFYEHPDWAGMQILFVSERLDRLIEFASEGAPQRRMAQDSLIIRWLDCIGYSRLEDEVIVRVNRILYGYNAASPLGAAKDAFGAFLNNLMSGIKWTAATTLDKIKEVVRTIAGYFGGLMEMIGGAIKSAFDKFITFVLDKLLSGVDPHGFLKRLKEGEFNTFIGVIVFILLMAFMSMCILSYAAGMYLATKLIRGLNLAVDQNLDFAAVGSPNIVSSVMAVLSYGFGGFGIFETDYLVKSCRNLVALAAGGTVLLNFSQAMVYLLPQGISDALVLKYGTSKQVAEMKVKNWIPEAIGLIKVSTVPTVLTSNQYYSRLTKCLSYAGTLTKEVPLELRTQFIGLYMQLLKISVILTQFQNANSQRLIPFSFHVAGKPGVGKTFMAYKLLREAFEVEPNHIYSRPVNTEYWSGYMNQKTIMYDEFLVGGAMTEEVRKLGLEYLQLVSPAPFQPDMASVDSPTVGMKGTYVSPEIVLTMNNTPYNSPDGLDVNAFQRRRNCVVEMVYRADAKLVENEPNKIDMLAYSSEERSNMEWAAFRVMPGQYNETIYRSRGVWIDYSTMKEMLINLKSEHDVISETISHTIHNKKLRPVNVDEVIEAALRSSYGIPEEKMDPKDAVLDLIVNSYSAVGRSKKSYTVVGKTKVPDQTVTTQEVQSTVSSLKQVEATTDVAMSLLAEVLSEEVVSVVEDEVGAIGGCSSDADSESSYADCDEHLALAMQIKETREEERRIEQIQLDRAIAITMLPANVPVITDPVELTRESLKIKRRPPGEGVKNFRADMQNSVMVGLDHIAREDGVVAGIDVERLHRHKCACGRNRGHAHVGNFNHDFMTKCDCKVVTEKPYVLSRRPEETNEQYWARIKDVYLEVGKAFSSNVEAMANFFIGLPGGYYSMLSAGFWAESGLRNFAQGFFTVIVGSVICLLIIKGIKMMAGLTSEDEDVTFSAASARSNRETKKQVKSKVTRGFARPEAVGSDAEVVDILVTGFQPVHCIPICERWVMTYAHSFSDGFVKEGQKIEVRYRNQTYLETIVEDMFYFDWANDVCFYQFQNRQIPQFPNSINKFLTSTDISNLGSCCIRLPFETKTVFSRGSLRTPGIEYSSDVGPIRQDRIFLSEFATTRGDCGTPAVATSGVCSGKILGFVVASNMSDKHPNTLINIVTRDMITSVVKNEFPDLKVDEEVEFTAVGLDNLGPNIRKIEKITRAEKIYVPCKTKLEPSLFSDKVPFNAVKTPAILTVNDPRSLGVDPIEVGIQGFSKTEQGVYDSQVLDDVFQDMKENYKIALKDFDLDGEMTIEEAIGGVPGKLSSLKVDTSPGYPRVLGARLSGKRDCFYFDSKGILVINDQFRADVHEMLDNLKKGVKPDHRWLGFLKDELVSQKKIKSVRTRVIYCGDVTLVVVLRMLYGKVLLGFNNISESTPMSIGLNQYSHDMQVIYNYLTEKGFTKFVAGDYEAFDQRMQREFQDRAYDLILGYASVDPEVNELVKQTQMDADFQIGDYRFSVESGNASGCLFTSVLNSLVNEAYFRYCFHLLNPEKVYDRHVRAKFLGDDHLLAVSDECRFGGKDIASVMPELKQVYTSDDKDSLEIPQHRKFEECTFLGAHPKRVENSWVGALKKETIMQTILWTRNKNSTILEEAETMIEYAALWEDDFYYKVRNSVVEVLESIGMELRMPSKRSLAKEVAYRTAASGKDFPKFTGCGTFTAVGIQQTPGLTVISTDTDQTVQRGGASGDTSLSFNQKPMDLAFSSDSLVNRKSLDWAESDAVGKILTFFTAPAGLLQLGGIDNLQNMPFTRYLYWRGDIELVVQTSGTPFQQGLLCLFWYPMTELTTKFPEIEQWTQCQHVFLSPNDNTTGTLTVPFSYFKKAFSNVADFNLGTFVLGVFSPLVDGNSQTNTVTIYSRFPKSDFILPLPTGTTFQAVGAGSSRVENKYTYNIRDIAGGMPIEHRQIGNTQNFDTKVTASLPGLDNPMVAGCSVPVVNKFSSLTKTEGLEPTTNLTMVQEEVSTEHFQYEEPGETLVSNILDKPAFLGSFTWKDTGVTDDIIYDVNLDSMLTREVYKFGDVREISASLAILNSFMFWHADIEFEFRAVKTCFHSGRLRVVTGYGLQEFSGADNKYFNAVLDFDGENSVHRVLVPYNAALEWLETWKGEARGTLGKSTTSLGRMKLVVQTKLRHPANVSDSVAILVFARFKNARVSVPRPVPFFRIEDSSRSWTAGAVTAVDPAAPKFKAVGVEPVSVPNIVPDAQASVDSVEVEEQIAVTDVTSGSVGFSRFNIGRKFEHEVKDIHEVVRRKIGIVYDTTLGSPEEAEVFSNKCYPIIQTIGVNKSTQTKEDSIVEVSILNGPASYMSYFFCFWAGSLSYRIHTTDPDFVQVSYQPGLVDFATYNFGNSGISFPDSYHMTDTAVQFTCITNQNQSAREVCFPLGGNNWIDINVPFQVTLDRLTTGESYVGHAGVLSFPVAIDKTSVIPKYVYKVFQGAGDDFRFSHWRPPFSILAGLQVQSTLAAAKTTNSSLSFFGFSLPHLIPKKP